MYIQIKILHGSSVARNAFYSVSDDEKFEDLLQRSLFDWDPSKTIDEFKPPKMKVQACNGAEYTGCTGVEVPSSLWSDPVAPFMKEVKKTALLVTLKKRKAVTTNAFIRTERSTRRFFVFKTERDVQQITGRV